MNTDWSTLWPVYLTSIGQTLWMVLVTMLIGGFFGLVLGLLLYTTRRGGLLQNSPSYTVLNVLVNFIRPIPFIIFITAVGRLTLLVMGTTIGTAAAIFPLVIAASFGISRIVEQNLVTIDLGVIEAARAMGTGVHPMRFEITRAGDGADAKVMSEKSTFVVPR